MARGATHVVGLDIGTKTIKAVELRLNGQTIVLEGVPILIPTPLDSVLNGRIVDEDVVSRAISQGLAESHCKTKKVVASVGGDTDVVVRIAELPRVEAKELDEAVQWELDRQTPFPVDQVIYDFEAIDHPGASPEAENMEVFLAVAQEDMVNAHAEALLAAKLMPVAIDVEPLALCRALIWNGEEHLLQSTVVVVNIGHTGSMIAIFCQGVPVFVRTIPTAGDALTAALRQELALSEVDAERVKRQFGNIPAGGGYAEDSDEYQDEYEDEFGPADTDSVFEVADDSDMDLSDVNSDDVGDAETRLDVEGAEYYAPEATKDVPEMAASDVDQDIPQEVAYAREQVGEALYDRLSELATEVRRSVQHYQRGHRNEEITKLIISGGSAALPGIATFFEDELGISAEVADPFRNVQVDLTVTSEAYLRDIGPAASIAVGLALRDMLD